MFYVCFGSDAKTFGKFPKLVEGKSKSSSFPKVGGDWANSEALPINRQVSRQNKINEINFSPLTVCNTGKGTSPQMLEEELKTNDLKTSWYSRTIYNTWTQFRFRGVNNAMTMNYDHQKVEKWLTIADEKTL
jgi:hypothetical protein